MPKWYLFGELWALLLEKFGNGMYTKIKILINLLADMGTIIFLCFVWDYNQRLIEIQDQYNGILQKAFYVVREPAFYPVMVAGLIVVVILIMLSVWMFSLRHEIKKIYVLIFILLHLIMIMALIEAYSNPIFTSFAIVSGFGGLLMISHS